MRSQFCGECIYCGSKENLTDEHAIPFGLGGNHILRDASCLNCNKVTSLFERKILHNSMLATRTVQAMPTRKKQNRPVTLPMIFVRKGVRTEELVPIEDAIPSLILPELGPPEINSAMRHAVGLRSGAFEIRNHFIIDRMRDDFLIKLLNKYGAEAIGSPFEINHDSFLRLLAKIGMAEAIFFYGMNFESIFVRDSVLGKDRPQRWVGSDGFYDIYLEGGFEGSSHVVRTIRNPGETEVRMRVKLWHKSITPEYIVIVGRIRKDYANFLDAHGLVA